MNSSPGKQLGGWTALAMVAGLVPIGLFWWYVGRVPGLSVAEAKRLLGSAPTATVLVDVRPAVASASRRPPGAVHWPERQIRALTSASDLPPELRGKTLLLLGEDELSAARAARRLRARPALEAYRIPGGVSAWLAYGDGKTSDLPFRPMRLWQQWLAVIVAFGVKPVYMLLSLLLIIWLWRQRALDLAALRWGLIWFWLGENACSIDYLFFARSSDFWEYLHGYGMAVGFAFVIYAFLEGLDHRVIKFSPEKERCAALRLCRACMKYADVPCGLKRLFLATIPALVLLACMPLCAPFNLTSYDTIILGTVHNYYHLASSQWFELRYCAVLAFLLFALSWLVLLFKRHDPVGLSKALFAAAAGPLGFGVLRMFFVSTFREDLMWFDVWEEITELLSILSIGVVLWVFRQSLFTEEPVASTPPQTLAPARP